MKNLSLFKFLALLFLVISSSAHATTTLLVFGDSLSAGYGIARDASWPQLLQDKLMKNYPDFTVVNASISGETTAGGLRRITPALAQHHPDIVIIELGANDGLRGGSLTEMRKNLSLIIERVQRAHARVLLVGMRLPPNYGKRYVDGFQNNYTRLAQQHRVTLLPFLLEGVPAEHFQPDNLHPSADAQPRIMENILLSLRPLLSK